VTVRASVLQADGTWLGYTNPDTGQLTVNGQPLYWYDGTTWQQVTPPTVTYDENGTPVVSDPGGYDHVYWWDGSVWRPWSDTTRTVLGAAWKGNSDGATLAHHDFGSYPQGLPIVIWAANGIADIGAPDDWPPVHVDPTTIIPGSPSFPTALRYWAEAGPAGYPCADPGEEPFTGDIANPLGLWTPATANGTEGVVPRVTGWNMPLAENALYGAGAPFIGLPISLTGVTTLDNYVFCNCIVGSTDSSKPTNVNKVRWGSSPAPRGNGVVLRIVALYSAAVNGGETVVPGPCPVPDGCTQLYSDTQAWNQDPGAIAARGLRLAVFTEPATAGVEVPEREVDCGNDATALWYNYLSCTVVMV